MARSKAPSPEPLPEYLAEFLAGLEAQVMAGEMPDRDKALRPIEQKLGHLIDIEAELKEHPEAAERFDLIWKRVRLRLEDGAVDRAANGKASATTLLRGMGAITSPAAGRRSGTGRLQLEREHTLQLDKYRTGW